MSWRTGLGAAVVIVVVVFGGLAGFYFALRAMFNPPAPTAIITQGADPLLAQKEDVAQFAKLVALDRSFRPLSRQQAQASLNALAARSDLLLEPQFRMALMKIGALADNGQKIVGELTSIQGKPVDIGGYYMVDAAKAEAVMCPSPTLNAALAPMRG